MRKYTLLISVVVHAAAVCALFVAPLLATGALPTIHDRTSWMSVRVAPPPAFGDSSRRPRAARTLTPALGATASQPTEAPPTIEPESDVFAPVTHPGGPGGAVEGDPGLGGLGPGSIDGVVGGDPRQMVLFAPPAPAPTRTIVHAGGRISAPKKLTHVPPVYPQVAIRARVQGDVILEALIAEDGSVQNVKVLRSVALLDQAAIAAVRQWRFSASTLNDQPIAVLMTVTVRFELQ